MITYAHDMCIYICIRIYIYTYMDKAHRPFQVWRHTLGTEQKEDVKVFEVRPAISPFFAPPSSGVVETFGTENGAPASKTAPTAACVSVVRLDAPPRGRRTACF